MKKFKSILGAISLSTLGILAACGNDTEVNNEPLTIEDISKLQIDE